MILFSLTLRFNITILFLNLFIHNNSATLLAYFTIIISTLTLSLIILSLIVFNRYEKRTKLAIFIRYKLFTKCRSLQKIRIRLEF